MIDLMFIAVTSGLIGGVTSCVLPTYPALLNIISRNPMHRGRSTIIFVLGLTLAYIIFYTLLGILIMLYGWGFAENLDGKKSILFLVAAFIAFFFAFDTLVHLNIIKKTLVVFNKVDYPGNLGTFITGVSYGSIITPCGAPFLITGIMPLLASKITYSQGVILMILFSLSLSLPILLLGLSSAYALKKIRFLQDNTRKIEFLSVLFLITVGFYFLNLYLVG